MNARIEAQVKAGEDWEARVLEPSPPAVNAPPWFADDPVASGDAGSRPSLAPVSMAERTWDQLAAERPELAPWCAERWLGGYRRLGPVPDSLVATRLALHSLAERVISPAREQANGKIALRYTRGGFGTPFFGADAQVRVDGAELVVQQGDTERLAPITTLRAALKHLGPALLELDDGELPDEPLTVEPVAAAFLGDWYGFCASVLEELRAVAGPATEPSRVQLWPEHFDLAVELGSEGTGARAGYGGSPGDELRPEPYLYVVPWQAPPAGELWQADGFTGAELSYAELLAAADQRGVALEFLRARLAALTS